MKKVLIVLFVVWMGAGAYALSFLGPPTAELEKTTRRDERNKEVARFEDRHGYVFSYAQMDIGSSGGGTLEDFELTRHYYTWGIALDENFNFNLLLGAVSGEIDNSDLGSTDDFGGDNGFSAGFNLKSTFHHGEKVDWGAMVQTTYFSTKDTVDGDTVEFDDVYDIQVAVGPTLDLGRLKLYGGAYYYMLDADLETDTGTVDIDEEDNFGGFIGGQINIKDNIDFGVEYSMGNESYNLGFSFGITF